MFKILFLLFFSASAPAAYPPTTTQGSADPSFVTTFNFAFPNVTMSHSGTTATFGVVSPASGGTGQSSLTTNNVILGNGTSPVQFVAPGASGNILQSNGTTWQSAANSAGDVVGPALSVSGAIATFQGTTGKSIHQSGLTGIASLTSGVLSTSATISMSAGGTGAAVTPSLGAVAWSTASAISLTAVGVSNAILTSSGAGAPVFSNQVTAVTISGSVINTANTISLNVNTLSFEDPTVANRTVLFNLASVSTPRTVTWPNNSFTVTGTANAATLTNKTMDGASNTFTNIPLGTAVTGTLALARGGLGQGVTATNGGVLYSTASVISVTPAGSAGNLLLSGGAATPTWLSNGSTGTALTISGGTGQPVWATEYGVYKNRLINPTYSIDMRNNGSAQTITAGAALAYTVDRWYAYATGGNVTGQKIEVTGPDWAYYRFTGGASNTAINFCQRVEAKNSYDMFSDTATISASFSNSLLTTVSWSLSYANTADTFGTVASPTVTSIATGSWTVNSTLTRYNAQVAIPAGATTGLQLCFSVANQTSGTWVISGTQLERGPIATALERRSYAVESLLAARYLPAFRETATNDVYPFVGSAATTTAISGTMMFYTPARVKPTGVTVSSAGDFKLVRHATGALTASGITFASAGANGASVQWTVTGATVDQTYYLHAVSAGVIYFTGCEL